MVPEDSLEALLLAELVDELLTLDIRGQLVMIILGESQIFLDEFFPDSWCP